MSEDTKHNSRIHTFRRWISSFFHFMWMRIYPQDCEVDGCCFTKYIPKQNIRSIVRTVAEWNHIQKMYGRCKEIGGKFCCKICMDFQFEILDPEGYIRGHKEVSDDE